MALLTSQRRRLVQTSSALTGAQTSSALTGAQTSSALTGAQTSSALTGVRASSALTGARTLPKWIAADHRPATSTAIWLAERTVAQLMGQEALLFRYALKRPAWPLVLQATKREC